MEVNLNMNPVVNAENDNTKVVNGGYVITKVMSEDELKEQFKKEYSTTNVTVNPILVSDEAALLIAKEQKETSIVNAVKHVSIVGIVTIGFVAFFKYAAKGGN